MTPATHPQLSVHLKDIERLKRTPGRCQKSWDLAPAEEKDLSSLLLKQFYATFNSVSGRSNRFWQRQMLMFSVTLFEMWKLSKAVFTDSHPWAHAVIHCPSSCASRQSRFSPSEKNEEWFMFHCLDVSRHLSKLHWATGWIFWLLFSLLFFPTSASTSPSAVFLFSLRMNWNKYHLLEGAEASFSVVFLWLKASRHSSSPPSQPLPPKPLFSRRLHFSHFYNWFVAYCSMLKWRLNADECSFCFFSNSSFMFSVLPLIVMALIFPKWVRV